MDYILYTPTHSKISGTKLLLGGARSPTQEFPIVGSMTFQVSGRKTLLLFFVHMQQLTDESNCFSGHLTELKFGMAHLCANMEEIFDDDLIVFFLKIWPALANQISSRHFTGLLIFLIPEKPAFYRLLT